MNTRDKIELPPLPARWEPKLREFVESWGRAAIEADAKRRGSIVNNASTSSEPVTEVPEGWREQFKDAVYDNLAAADNQDIPLEEYPDRIVEVLESIVGSRHPTVVMWRNDAIKQCAAITYKYCDPESYQYLKQDLEALLTPVPQPAEPVAAIERLLNDAMDTAVANGADSRTMPDDYVDVAAWLCGVRPQPAEPVRVDAEATVPSDDALRKLSMDFMVGGGWSQWSVDVPSFARALLARYG